MTSHIRLHQTLEAVDRLLQDDKFVLQSASSEEAKQFGDLKIGDEFFDPFCGEAFKKISDTQAECLSGGDAFEGEVDDFEPDDRVQPAE